MKSFQAAFTAAMQAISPDVAARFYDPAHLRAYDKGKCLVQAGTVSAHSFLVEDGVLRKYYLKAGAEVTTEFVFQ